MKKMVTVLCVVFKKIRYENQYVYTSKCQQENIKTSSKKFTFLKTI